LKKQAGRQLPSLALWPRQSQAVMPNNRPDAARWRCGCLGGLNPCGIYVHNIQSPRHSTPTCGVGGALRMTACLWCIALAYCRMAYLWRTLALVWLLAGPRCCIGALLPVSALPQRVHKRGH
jgi:hypothetical protein